MIPDVTPQTRRFIAVTVVLAGMAAALGAWVHPGAAASRTVSPHTTSTAVASTPAPRLTTTPTPGRHSLAPHRTVVPWRNVVPWHSAETSPRAAAEDALTDLRDLDHTVRAEHLAAGTAAPAIDSLTRYVAVLRAGTQPAATARARYAPSQVAGTLRSMKLSAGTSRAAVAVRYAFAQLGKPYVWGAAGPDAFDCSGLVMRAWGSAGVSLPHYTYSIWRVGRHITRAQLRPGDLVFPHGLGHVQIYIGGGNVIEAPHTGALVRIRPLIPHAYGYLTVSR